MRIGTLLAVIMFVITVGNSAAYVDQYGDYLVVDMKFDFEIFTNVTTEQSPTTQVWQGDGYESIQCDSTIDVTIKFVPSTPGLEGDGYVITQYNPENGEVYGLFFLPEGLSLSLDANVSYQLAILRVFSFLRDGKKIFIAGYKRSLEILKKNRRTQSLQIEAFSPDVYLSPVREPELVYRYQYQDMYVREKYVMPPAYNDGFRLEVYSASANSYNLEEIIYCGEEGCAIPFNSMIIFSSLVFDHSQKRIFLSEKNEIVFN